MAGGNSIKPAAGASATGLYERLQGQRAGDRATGRSWVAKPFLRWSLFGVSFLLFGAFFGIVALNGTQQEGEGRSYMAVYLTDAPPELDGLLVHLAAVDAGARGQGTGLEILVGEFDLAAHRGRAGAFPVAHGWVLPHQREQVSIEFASAVGLRGSERIPVEFQERRLHLEYQGGAGGAEGSAVLFDVDLGLSLNVETRPDGTEAIVFTPTVTEVVHADATPLTSDALRSGLPVGAFLEGSGAPPLRQYRAVPTATASTSTSTPTASASTPATTTAASPALSLGKLAPPSSTSTTPTSATPTSGTNRAPAAPSAPTPFHGAASQPSAGTLTWQGTDPDGDPLKFYVYFGTAATPSEATPYCIIDLRDPGASRSCAYSGTSGATHHWRVHADDRRGGVASSAVFSFTVAGGSASTSTTSTTTSAPTTSGGGGDPCKVKALCEGDNLS